MDDVCFLNTFTVEQGQTYFDISNKIWASRPSTMSPDCSSRIKTYYNWFHGQHDTIYTGQQEALNLISCLKVPNIQNDCTKCLKQAQEALKVAQNDIKAAVDSLFKKKAEFEKNMSDLRDLINPKMSNYQALNALIDIFSDFLELYTDATTPGQKTFSNASFTCVFGASPVSYFLNSSQSIDTGTLYSAHIDRLEKMIASTVLKPLGLTGQNSDIFPFKKFTCFGMSNKKWIFETNIDSIYAWFSGFFSVQPCGIVCNTISLDPFNIIPLKVSDCTCLSQYCDISNVMDKSYRHVDTLVVNSITIIQSSNIDNVKQVVAKHPENLPSLNSFTMNCKIDGIDICNLVGLTTLDLSGSSLCELPDIISMKNLKNLVLRKNRIKCISSSNYTTCLLHPNMIPQSVEKLELDNNQILNAQFLTELKNLTFLKISGNVIENFPNLSSSRNLKEISFKDNRIQNEAIDKSIPQSVEKLDLSGNNINAAYFLQSLVNLICLNISANKIEGLPDLSKLSQLKEISFRNNLIKTTSNNITKYLPSGLTKIDFNTNQLSSWIDLSNFGDLTHFSIDGKQNMSFKLIKPASLPDSFFKTPQFPVNDRCGLFFFLDIPSVRKIDLSKISKLSNFCYSLANTCQLSCLMLPQTIESFWPGEICSSARSSVLSKSFFKGLTKLKQINLSMNPLNSFDFELGSCDSLESIVLVKGLANFSPSSWPNQMVTVDLRSVDPINSPPTDIYIFSNNGTSNVRFLLNQSEGWGDFFVNNAAASAVSCEGSDGVYECGCPLEKGFCDISNWVFGNVSDARVLRYTNQGNPIKISYPEKLSNLTTLDLSSNDFNTWPDLSGLTNVKDLDLSSNKLNFETFNIAYLPLNLKNLKVEQNPLSLTCCQLKGLASKKISCNPQAKPFEAAMAHVKYANVSKTLPLFQCIINCGPDFDSTKSCDSCERNKNLSPMQIQVLNDIVDMYADFYKLYSDDTTPGQITFSNATFTCIFGASPLTSFFSIENLENLYASHVDRLNERVSAMLVAAKFNNSNSPFTYVFNGGANCRWSMTSLKVVENFLIWLKSRSCNSSS